MTATITTVAELDESLKSGRYTSVGSYPKFWMTADNSILSYQAVLDNREEIVEAIKTNGDKAWNITRVSINWEDAALHCSHTCERIESAYNEPEATNG